MDARAFSFIDETSETDSLRYTKSQFTLQTFQLLGSTTKNNQPFFTTDVFSIIEPNPGILHEIS